MIHLCRELKAIVTIPPLAEEVKDSAGNVIRRGGAYRVKVLAVKPGWEILGYLPESFLLAELSGKGYSTSDYQTGCNVLVPEGYQVIAVMVDKDGCAKAWESLPVLLECESEDIAPESSSRMVVKDGEIFIQKASVKPFTIQKVGVMGCSAPQITQTAGNSDEQ